MNNNLIKKKDDDLNDYNLVKHKKQGNEEEQK